MKLNLVADPNMSRALARVRNHPTVRSLGHDWWDRFLEEAQEVTAIDDLPPQYRDVVGPLVEGELVYAAEDQTQQVLGELEPLSPDELESFALDALRGAGFENAEVPVFRFDIPDDSEMAGKFERRPGKPDTIRIHPDLLGRWVVLHELAHWCRPNDKHGPQFRAALVRLVRAALGDDEAKVLISKYEEFELPLDEVWVNS